MYWPLTAFKVRGMWSVVRAPSWVPRLGVAVAWSSIAVTTTGLVAAQDREPIRPIPIETKLDSRKVSLGEKLFHDRRLSRDNTIACASCHDLTKGGTDRLPFSIGVGGAKGTINAPTVFNAAFNFRQFWDGRASSLEEQATIPIHDPIEMGSNWKDVVSKLGGDKVLRASFNEIYPDGVQPKNIQDAIATFERSLTTPNSRFDRYLRGNKSALTGEELRGYELFKNYGCVACHQGVNVGGNMFQRFGVMDDYLSKRGAPTTKDLGRYNVTKNETDKFVFKVPSLRNVALTVPYFHDGSAGTLEEAVTVMIRFQLGRPVPEADKALIVKFLHTLTGEYKGAPL